MHYITRNIIDIELSNGIVLKYFKTFSHIYIFHSKNSSGVHNNQAISQSLSIICSSQYCFWLAHRNSRCTCLFNTCFISIASFGPPGLFLCIGIVIALSLAHWQCKMDWWKTNIFIYMMNICIYIPDQSIKTKQRNNARFLFIRCTMYPIYGVGMEQMQSFKLYIARGQPFRSRQSYGRPQVSKIWTTENDSLFYCDK